MNLSTAASQLNRVGSVLKRSLGRLGIETVKDLLYYFPFRYEDYSQVVRIKDLQDGQEVTVRGKIELIGNKRSPRKQTMITEALVADETGQLRIIWFGQPFIVKILKAGDEVFLSGKVKSDMFGVQITGPSYEKVRSSGVSLNTPLPPVRLVPLSHHEVSSRLEASRGEDDGVISTTHTARIVPIYSLTAGVTEKQLRFLVSQAIGVRSQVPEWVPEEIRDTADLMPIDEALRAIHFPESQEELDHAVKRLKFDEVFLLQLRAEMTRQSIKRSQAPKLEFKEKETKEFVSSLPFKLTKDQKVSAWEILQDIQKSEPMNRLLEGDVGSGKTVVASMALYNTVLNGYQGVMMAPTEILAKQHFESLINLFKNLNVRVGLLSRSQVLIYGDTIEIHGDSKKIFQPISTYRNVSKQDFLKEMQEGNLQIIVGTHALLTESVQFKNLGLVIVDEQHRFGVNQRAALIRGQTRTVADERGPLTDADLR
ncbi:MAG: DEAD/DEAH box helicase, partial [Candidatus Magasanikbacteria bacterium]|nr:DEAD/DEAH box helicase [Candidatus Magasanikbacteria bacterium]